MQMSYNILRFSKANAVYIEYIVVTYIKQTDLCLFKIKKKY